MRFDPLPDVEFVIVAYGVIIGGLGLYTVTLWRRLNSARRQLDRDDEAR